VTTSPGRRRGSIRRCAGEPPGVLSTFIEALKESGELISTQALVGPSQAAVVSVRNRRPVVTDGPFLESMEYLGGFYLIGC
jgi:hypothetical protein